MLRTNTIMLVSMIMLMHNITCSSSRYVEVSLRNGSATVCTSLPPAWATLPTRSASLLSHRLMHILVFYKKYLHVARFVMFPTVASLPLGMVAYAGVSWLDH